MATTIEKAKKWKKYLFLKFGYYIDTISIYKYEQIFGTNILDFPFLLENIANSRTIS